MNIAVLQLTSGEDVNANVEQILKIAASLDRSLAVDLICLPENSLFLRISKSTPLPELTLDSVELAPLQRFVNETGWAMMIGSFPLKEGGERFNTTVLLAPRVSPEVLYRKLHLFDVDVPGAPPVRESESFAHGSAPQIFERNGWKIGLSICYDLRFSELYRGYSKAGVDLILIPSAFLVPTGKAHWEVLLRARAIENQCYVVAAAQGGEHVNAGQEKRHTYGHSMVVNPWGEVILELSDGNRVGYVRLEKSAIETVRRQIPMQKHRRDRKWETEN